jgi:hypothetical protein
MDLYTYICAVNTIFWAVCNSSNNNVLLLDAFYLLLLSPGPPLNFEPKLFLLIIFYNGTLLII